MKITKLALTLLVGIGTGCTTVPPAPLMSEMPDCFDANYDKDRGLFTIRNDAGNTVNQQCLLRVGPRGDVAAGPRLPAGRYSVYLANGGGGGAGGTFQSFGVAGGGGGGGGAGAAETRATVNLTEGVYKLTLGAGGPGGSACMPPPVGLGGGPGWAGSPSNMVRIATGEVLVGTPGADTYARPTRAQSERTAGKMDAHGGSGPGQASGGHGGVAATGQSAKVEATAGAGQLASGGSGVGGAAGPVGSVTDLRSGTGGGGGATSVGQGGGGGGETSARKDIDPQRGSLGSGGGGGEGARSECEPGARGGHGYIALRPI